MQRPPRPSDLAERAASQGARRRREIIDGFVRNTFVLERQSAREQARAMLDRFPKAAYMTEVESWRELPDGKIEFTMRRLPTAD
jgi:hypothetical protein